MMTTFHFGVKGVPQIELLKLYSVCNMKTIKSDKAMKQWCV